MNYSRRRETEPGYLYHKQPDIRGKRRRHNHDSEPDRRFTERNVARESFWRNIRVFIYMVMLMVIILASAFYIARKNWRDKQARIRAHRYRKTQTPSAGQADTRARPSESSVDESSAFNDVDDAIAQKAVFLVERGSAFADAGNPREAVKRYHQALTLWADTPDAWDKLGQAYMQLDQVDKALEALDQALKRDPAAAGLLNRRALAYMRQGKFDAARQDLQHALNADPACQDSYLNLAMCCLAQRQRNDARKILVDYIERYPDDMRALKDLAFVEASDGHYAQALTLLRMAIEQDPQWDELYFDAAATCALMEKPAQALAFLQQAEPHSSPAAIHGVYQQPAFSSIRTTEQGRAYALELVKKSTLKKEDDHPHPVAKDDQHQHVEMNTTGLSGTENSQ